MSKLEVDAIEPQSGTTLTIGASGDTISVPSGATLSSTDPLVFPAGSAASPAITTTGDTNTGIFFPAADTIAFSEGGAEAMRIDSSGNVGIGISSPTSPLHIKSASNPKFHVITASPTAGYNAGFLVSAGNSASGSSRTVTLALDADGGDGTGSDNFTIKKIGGSPGNVELTQEGSANIIFKTANTERMRIDSNGVVLVGRTVTGSSGNDNGVLLYPAGEIITSKVGTGLTTHIFFVNNTDVSATTVGTIQTSGSSTSYNTSSDYRLKENVDYNFDATTRLKQLKPARFNFIADADTTVDGFLAHEVQDIVPEAISGEKDAMKTEEYEVTPAVLDEDGNVITEAVMGTREVPDYQGIDQSKLVPLLVKTIQELEARITALETNNP